MIIFDLDGTLADCEHRRHFVDPKHRKNLEISDGCLLTIDANGGVESNHQIRKFKPNWKSFYEACDQDKPIYPVIQCIMQLDSPFEIWSGRCESVREKTIEWLKKNTNMPDWALPTIRMRPIGDNTPDDVLKEKWFDKLIISDAKKGRNFGELNIDFVFQSDQKSIKMWRRRGVFVFNCAQSEHEF